MNNYALILELQLSLRFLVLFFLANSITKLSKAILQFLITHLVEQYCVSSSLMSAGCSQNIQTPIIGSPISGLSAGPFFWLIFVLSVRPFFWLGVCWTASWTSCSS